MSNEVNFDGATEMPLTGIYASMMWVEMVLSHFEDDGVTPFPLVDYGYKFVVSKDVNEVDVRLMADVTVEGNEMRVAITQEQNILKAGQYHYRIYSDEEPYPIYYGLLTVHHKKSHFV